MLYFQVSFGMEQVKFPIFILCSGVLISLFMILGENIRGCKRKKLLEIVPKKTKTIPKEDIAKILKSYIGYLLKCSSNEKMLVLYLERLTKFSAQDQVSELENLLKETMKHLENLKSQACKDSSKCMVQSLE